MAKIVTGGAVGGSPMAFMIFLHAARGLTHYSNPVGIVDRLGNRHPRRATESATSLSTQSVKISTRNAPVAALRLDPRTSLTPRIAGILEAANRVAPAIPSIEPKLSSPLPSLRAFGKETGGKRKNTKTH